MSALERSPSYRESNKGSKEKQGPTLGVPFTEVSVKKELTVEPFITIIDFASTLAKNVGANDFWKNNHHVSITILFPFLISGFLFGRGYDDLRQFSAKPF